jgi:hypothetical protein
MGIDNIIRRNHMKTTNSLSLAVFVALGLAISIGIVWQNHHRSSQTGRVKQTSNLKNIGLAFHDYNVNSINNYTSTGILTTNITVARPADPQP